MKVQNLWALASILLVSNSGFSASTPAAAKTVYALDAQQSSVEFIAVGRPSALRIRGKGAKPEGKISFENSKVSGEFLINLKEFESGISLRDRHMKEKYLEVEKPGNDKAKLSITEISMTPRQLSKPGFSGEGKFSGKLSLHGKEQPVSGSIDLKSTGEHQFKGDAKMKLKIADFGIDIPSFSGITVANDVDVAVSFVAKKQ